MTAMPVPFSDKLKLKNLLPQKQHLGDFQKHEDFVICVT
jgi:hypothetical protein